jgi:HSP20 family protein
MPDFFEQETADLAEDARRLLNELDRDVPGVATIGGECRPPTDVLETAEAVEVVVDVPGVLIESLRVAVRRSTVLIVGAKHPPANVTDVRFHLAERGYGRFARAVRVLAAIDAGRSTAIVAAGQLRVILPRIEDRRGKVIMVPVKPG